MPIFTTGQQVMAKVVVTNGSPLTVLASARVTFGAPNTTPGGSSYGWPYVTPEVSIPVGGQVAFPLPMTMPDSPQNLGVLIVDVYARYDAAQQPVVVTLGQSDPNDSVSVIGASVTSGVTFPAIPPSPRGSSIAISLTAKAGNIAQAFPWPLDLSQGVLYQAQLRIGAEPIIMTSQAFAGADGTGPVTLSGKLLLPSSPGQYPLVVDLWAFGHGSSALGGWFHIGAFQASQLVTVT